MRKHLWILFLILGTAAFLVGGLIDSGWTNHTVLLTLTFLLGQISGVVTILIWGNR